MRLREITDYVLKSKDSLFQFQYGAIKRYLGYSDAGGLGSFNSNTVRLRVIPIK